MIDKYTRPEMGHIWSTENKYRCWLRVEIAVAEAWAAVGRVPENALPAIRNATFDLDRIAEIEEETQHDVIAFLRNLAETVGPDARWIHLGLTSSDVVDTALALQLIESTDLLLRDVDTLRCTLGESALRYRHTVMMGRTHNVHAEPITFGYKLAVWYAEMERHRERLERVRSEVAVAKISGAVGTHANVPPEIEERVALELELKPEPVSTQVVQRDRHASYVLALALLASSLDKMASELRNLQHTEILEVEEPFRQGQQGSSAMPHKRNPILNERISGLARVVRGYVVPALENVVLWHERDISNSSVERVILPDASILVDYMLAVFDRVLRGLAVNTDRMEQNVEASRGLHFSEKVLTALVESGMSRPEAYTLVQRAAMQSWRTGEPFRMVLEEDPEVTSRLSPADLESLFDVSSFLRYIDTAFARLGLLSSQSSLPSDQPP
jgi:adenylosuccinate lyase